MKAGFVSVYSSEETQVNVMKSNLTSNCLSLFVETLQNIAFEGNYNKFLQFSRICH